MKIPKFNQKGITHLLAPLLFVIVFAGICSIVLLKSHAATVCACGGGGTRDPHAYMVGGFVTHGDQKLKGAYVHFSYTRSGHQSGVTLLSRGHGWYQFRAYPNTTYTITADYIYQPTNAAKTTGKAWVSNAITIKTGNNGGPIKNLGKNIPLTQSKTITIPECLGNLKTCSATNTGGTAHGNVPTAL